MISGPRRWGPPYEDPTDPDWDHTVDLHELPPAPDLDVADNPEIGRLYGPDGALISIVRARPQLPFGFGPG